MFSLKQSTPTTAINTLFSLQVSKSTQTNIGQVINLLFTTDSGRPQSCSDFRKITTMSKPNSSHPTPKEIVHSLMSFVKTENKLMTNNATGNEVSKVFLNYRCPKPGCPKPIVIFVDKSGFNNPFSHLQSCYGRGGSLQERGIILKELFEKGRQDVESKGGTKLSISRVQRGLSTIMPCTAICDELF